MQPVHLLWGFYVGIFVFHSILSLLLYCHYYVGYFTITYPFCWLVAIYFIRPGLMVAEIYFGLAQVLYRVVERT